MSNFLSRIKSEEEKSFLHVAKIIACFDCDKIFKSRNDFVIHDCKTNSYEKKHNEERYQCEFCAATYFTKRKLNKHSRKEHGGDHLDKERVCPFCDKVFNMKPSIKGLFLHLKRSHGSENESYLFKEIANEFDLSKKLEAYTCDQCGKLYNSDHTLKDHKENVHHPDTFICPICGGVLKGKKSLAYHMVSHKEATISCEQCGRLYKEKRKLNRHMKIVHMKVQNYKCDVCERKFGTLQQMKKHKLAVHEKQKPYNCLDCEYRCARYGNLNSHWRNVHGKPWMPKSEYDGLIEERTKPPIRTGTAKGPNI